MSAFNNNYQGMSPVQREIHTAMVSIVADYCQLPKAEQSGRWATREIKLRIAAIGARLGFKSYSTEHVGEWLYDLIWFTEDERGNISSVELCLESELSTRSISGLKTDFEKLHVSNAKLKVFICHAQGRYDSPENVNDLIAYFNESVSALKSRAADESTLILIWDDYTTGDVVPHVI